MNKMIVRAMALGLFFAQPFSCGTPIVIQTGVFSERGFVRDGGEFNIDSSVLNSGLIDGLLEEGRNTLSSEPVHIGVSRTIFERLVNMLLLRGDAQLLMQLVSAMSIDELLDSAVACHYLQIIPTGEFGSALLNRIIGEFGAGIDVRDQRINRLCEITQTLLDRFYQEAVTTRGSWRQCILSGQAWLSCVAFSQNDQLIAITDSEGYAHIYNAGTGACTVFNLADEEVDDVFPETLAFSPNGQLIANVFVQSSTIGLWNVSTGTRVHKLVGHADHIYKVSFSFDGHYLASASADQTVRIWDVATGVAVRTINHPRPVFSASFSSDGLLLVTSCADNIIRIWNVATGQCLRALVGHTDSPTVALFSHNGRQVMSVSGSEECDNNVAPDNTLRIWDASTGTCPHHPIKAHDNVIYGLDVSFDDRFIISQSIDRTVCMWNALTGERVFRLDNLDTMAAVAFAHTSSLAAVASGNMLYLLQPPVLMQEMDNMQKLFMLRMIRNAQLAAGQEEALFDIYSTLGDTERKIVDNCNRIFSDLAAPVSYDSPIAHENGYASGPE